MVCSNPWNLDVSSVKLQSTWLGLEVYSKAMGTSMRGLVEQHAEELAKNTRVDLERVHYPAVFAMWLLEVQCWVKCDFHLKYISQAWQ